jgi:hypothetical protein
MRLATSNELFSTVSDWDEFFGLDKIVAGYQVGANSVVVLTDDGRQVRITAWRDLRTGEYTADFERRGRLTVDGHDYFVWLQTPAYRPCVADELETCLEAAIIEVDRVQLT